MVLTGLEVDAQEDLGAENQKGRVFSVDLRSGTHVSSPPPPGLFSGLSVHLNKRAQ